MKLLTLWIFLACGAVLTASAAGPAPVTADLAGTGDKQTYSLEVKPAGKDEPFTGGTLRAGSQTITLGEDFNGFSAKLEAYRVADDKGRVLVASARGESDYEIWFIFAIVNGKLTRMATLQGQGEISIPGNGTLILKTWMGFWNKTEKYVFGKDLTPALWPQEFYAVDAGGTVEKTFPVYQKRDGAKVIGNTKVGSKIKVLLWDPASQKPGDDSSMQNEWFLIVTETGFTGWARGKDLNGENVSLPWAG
ncbi:MAG: hypothetical protein ACAI35_09860 [Candidatus Methylacidiphilales bacterium]|nr:hypothetical protein [Candidatus Methylacidiphilales bacterium]